MSKITIYLADGNDLIREGFKSIIRELKDATVVGEAANRNDLIAGLAAQSPDLLVLDYCSSDFRVEDIRATLDLQPNMKVLAIIDDCNKDIVLKALRAGVTGHILKESDKQEITDAIYATSRGDNFYCGQVLDVIKEDSHKKVKLSSAPIVLSNREIEIIGFIAEGYINKKIAKKLFLSTHTIMTHRKNIMSKLGVNNTAGIVIYAVKENIISPDKFLFSPAGN